MRVIFGIGNKGNRYEKTRHNLGFIILDLFAQKYMLRFEPSKSNYDYCLGSLNKEEFILVKPTTYVNNSGIAASELFQNYNLGASDFLVVHDDLNLNFGVLRVKVSGGDGGHNGINSIIYHLNTNQFPRLRIGIGNNFDKGNMTDFVLSGLSIQEIDYINGFKETTNSLLEEFIVGGTQKMLNFYSKLIDPGITDPPLNQSRD